MPRSLLDAPDETLPSFWGEVVGAGWLGLHVDEEYGGSGYGLPELAVVLEELGGAAAPGPFLPTALAAAVISACADADARKELLPGLVDGSVPAAVGLRLATRARRGRIRRRPAPVRHRRAGDGWRARPAAARTRRDP